MTIIAACKDADGSIWMGADCISLHRGCDVKIGTTAKVFRLGEMLVGSSGTVRCRQIVEHGIAPASIPDDDDPVEWLVRTFVPVLRGAMKEHGGELSKDGGHEMDARLLIGLRGQIHELNIDYSVFTHRLHYATAGCADIAAQAAMLTALKLKPDMHARQVVQYGLEAAAECDINIRPPFEILCDKAEESVLELRLAG